MAVISKIEMSRPALHWWRSSASLLPNAYFRGKDPIGLRMKVGDRFDGPMPAITVVGVVGDVKQGALDQPTVAQMYEPISQAAAALGPMAAMLGVAGNMDVVIRTTDDPTQLIPSLEKIVHQLDPLLVVSRAPYDG